MQQAWWLIIKHHDRFHWIRMGWGFGGFGAGVGDAFWEGEIRGYGKW